MRKIKKKERMILYKNKLFNLKLKLKVLVKNQFQLKNKRYIIIFFL